MAGYLLLAVSVAFVASAGYFPALCQGHRTRRATFLALCIPILCSPLLIPAESSALRFLAALNAVALVLKLYDLHLDASQKLKPSLRTFLLFLLNWFSLVLRKQHSRRRPSRRANYIRLGGGILGTILGGTSLIGLFAFDWDGVPFFVEHCAKVIACYMTLVATAVGAVAVWRLLGGAAHDFMDRPYLARTPADFWRRHNCPAHQFLYEDVFLPLGGIRYPFRATVITFVISALVHEYVFGIAIGRIQGYQTMFFVIQGCAVVATMGVKPKGSPATLWIVGTALLNLATAVLFFASVNGVVRIYSEGLFH